MPIVNYVSLGLLFFSIIFSGRQIGLYLRLSKRMGKLLCELSPSKGQKKFLMVGGAIFIVLLIFVTTSYIAKDIGLGATYSGLIAVVIYSTGRFTSKVTELRENGILGHLNEITYSDVKSYKIENRTSRGSLKFILKDGREFVTLVSLVEIDGIKKVLQQKISS